MTAKFRHILAWFGDAFWLVPAVMVLCGAVLAFALLAIDRSDLVRKALVASAWLYNGGATGARILLGAVASSTIGVAGTAFSITIAALSLAAGQMGPRLLRSFVRDRGNQGMLGTFLGTFIDALLMPRSVRTLRDDRAVLVMPAVTYHGLTDAAFHLLRQNAAGSVAVLIRMLDMIGAVASCEHNPGRRASLTRHADLVMADAERTVGNPADLDDLRKRRRKTADASQLAAHAAPRRHASA